MHEQQRKFFNDPRRHVLSLGVRHGRTQYGQEIKQAIEKQAAKRNEITEIAIDECKEMTREDFEQVRDHPLLGKVEGGIQTAKSDWLRQRFAAGRRTGKTFESMGVPSIWALDVCKEDEESTDE